MLGMMMVWRGALSNHQYDLRGSFRLFFKLFFPFLSPPLVWRKKVFSDFDPGPGS